MAGTMPANPLQQIGRVFSSAARVRIVEELLPGPRTVEDLARVLGLGTVTVHHHLRVLTRAGLLEEIDPRRSGKSGRPASVYRLSGRPGDMTYPPRNYQLLASTLIEILATVAPKAKLRAAAAAVGDKHGRQLAEHLRQRAGRKKWTLVDVRRWFVEGHNRAMGLAPEVVASDDRSLRFRLHNCLFSEVAREQPEVVCGMEGPMLRAMLDGTLGEGRAEATIVQCMGNGHPHCEYLIEAKTLSRRRGRWQDAGASSNRASRPRPRAPGDSTSR